MEPDRHDPYWAEPIVGRGLRNYLQVLISTTITIGFIAWAIAFFADGAVLTTTAAAALLVFLIIGAMGAVVVAFKFLPLLIVVGVVLYSIHRWVGIF